MGCSPQSRRVLARLLKGAVCVCSGISKPLTRATRALEGLQGYRRLELTREVNRGRDQKSKRVSLSDCHATGASSRDAIDATGQKHSE